MTSEHIVRGYDKDLEILHRKIAEMGGLVEKMLSESIDALSSFDLDLARSVIAQDHQLDLMQREIEDKGVQTIARRQPVAIDLREIIAAIRISVNLERIGDLAKNVCNRVLAVAGDARLPRAVVGLKHMGDFAALQLKNVLDAYAARDPERAQAVWMRDAELDALDDSIFRELLTFMMEDARNITFCTHLLFCTKSIERMGDHATNIAETVYYLATGSNLPVDRPKGGTRALPS